MEFNDSVKLSGQEAVGQSTVEAKPNKVFVSGCFDLLHSGHVEFFKTAARYGELHVAIGSDENIAFLKNKIPVYSQIERLFMIKSLACVKDAYISTGMGVFDFLDKLEEIQPDFFVVNEDGHSAEKQKIVEDLGIQYVILKRKPPESLPVRSSTALKSYIQEASAFRLQAAQPIKIPYRIDLCGGWLDQPFVSRLCSGSVITFPIYGLPYEFLNHPCELKDQIEFSRRSGMATSTRNSAVDLWGNQIGYGEPQKLAQMLFAFNNPPGTEQISGAQDSIGIVVPGITKSFYNGAYWPLVIENITDESTVAFIEQHLCLVPLQPRVNGYNPLNQTNISVEGARALAAASRAVWLAIKNHDAESLGMAVTGGFQAQVAMFPHMTDEYINDFMSDVASRNQGNILGYKLSGAGGGGYMICVVKEPLVNSIVIKISREIIRD